MRKVYEILLKFKLKQISLTECEKQLNDYFFIKKVEKVEKREIFDKNICEFKGYCKNYRCIKSCTLSPKNDTLKNKNDDKFPA